MAEELKKNLTGVQELEDDDMTAVTGGTGTEPAYRTTTAYCPECKEEKLFRLGSGARAFCTKCNTQIMI